MDKKYLYPITAVICAVVLGGSFLLVQINKQNSIEEQKRIELRIENEKIFAEELAEKTRQNNIDTCIADAYYAYSQDWDKACETLGYEADCTLPTYRANDINDNKKYKEQNCYSRYK